MDAAAVGSSRPIDRVAVRSELRLVRISNVVGIDMPIGLADGPPASERHRPRGIPRARRAVRVPGTAACAPACPDYRSALAAARSPHGARTSRCRRSTCCRKLPKLDRCSSPADEHMFVEVHPECAFRCSTTGNGLPSKKTAAGADRTSPLCSPISSSIPAMPPRWRSGRRPARRLRSAVEHAALSTRRAPTVRRRAVDERGIAMRIVC